MAGAGVAVGTGAGAARVAVGTDASRDGVLVGAGAWAAEVAAGAGAVVAAGCDGSSVAAGEPQAIANTKAAATANKINPLIFLNPGIIATSIYVLRQRDEASDSDLRHYIKTSMASQ